MSVVSNASPLINLARVGQLDLLAQLYGELVVPEAVRVRWCWKAQDNPAQKRSGQLPGFGLDQPQTVS